MKPLPDLQDVEAMAAIGRVSALWSARNQTLEQLRDKLTAMNSAQFGPELEKLSTEAIALCARLNQIALMWAKSA
jgi:hypothetical protein